MEPQGADGGATILPPRLRYGANAHAGSPHSYTPTPDVCVSIHELAAALRRARTRVPMQRPWALPTLVGSCRWRDCRSSLGIISEVISGSISGSISGNIASGRSRYANPNVLPPFASGAKAFPFLPKVAAETRAWQDRVPERCVHVLVCKDDPPTIAELASVPPTADSQRVQSLPLVTVSCTCTSTARQSYPLPPTRAGVGRSFTLGDDSKHLIKKSRGYYRHAQCSPWATDLDLDALCLRTPYTLSPPRSTLTVPGMYEERGHRNTVCMYMWVPMERVIGANRNAGCMMADAWCAPRSPCRSVAPSHQPKPPLYVYFFGSFSSNTGDAAQKVSEPGRLFGDAKVESPSEWRREHELVCWLEKSVLQYFSPYEVPVTEEDVRTVFHAESPSGCTVRTTRTCAPRGRAREKYEQDDAAPRDDNTRVIVVRTTLASRLEAGFLHTMMAAATSRRQRHDETGRCPRAVSGQEAEGIVGLAAVRHSLSLPSNYRAHATWSWNRSIFVRGIGSLVTMGGTGFRASHHATCQVTDAIEMTASRSLCAELLAAGQAEASCVRRRNVLGSWHEAKQTLSEARLYCSFCELGAPRRGLTAPKTTCVPSPSGSVSTCAVHVDSCSPSRPPWLGSQQRPRQRLLCAEVNFVRTYHAPARSSAFRGRDILTCPASNAARIRQLVEEYGVVFPRRRRWRSLSPLAGTGDGQGAGWRDRPTPCSLLATENAPTEEGSRLQICPCPSVHGNRPPPSRVRKAVGFGAEEHTGKLSSSPAGRLRHAAASANEWVEARRPCMRLVRAVHAHAAVANHECMRAAAAGGTLFAALPRRTIVCKTSVCGVGRCTGSVRWTSQRQEPPAWRFRTNVDRPSGQKGSRGPRPIASRMRPSGTSALAVPMSAIGTDHASRFPVQGSHCLQVKLGADLRTERVQFVCHRCNGPSHTRAHTTRTLAGSMSEYELVSVCCHHDLSAQLRWPVDSDLSIVGWVAPRPSRDGNDTEHRGFRRTNPPVCCGGGTRRRSRHAAAQQAESWELRQVLRRWRDVGGRWGQEAVGRSNPLGGKGNPFLDSANDMAQHVGGIVTAAGGRSHVLDSHLFA
ncbi:hypothetical protein RJ55_08480 [Drechmeria coniospora]|nr:hypothetical protein RJ55_08480 [Drechmeria coniospora]